MTYCDAKELLRDVSAIFFAYHGMFTPFPPRTSHERYAYYYNFPTSRLSIVAFLPITYDTDGSLRMIDHTIAIVLKITKGPVLVNMEDVRLTHGWEDRLCERISILKQLVETEVRLCDTCAVVMLPRTMRRTDPPHTHFVALHCPLCKHCAWTVFGKGLKKRLHTNLKKIKEKK